MENQATSVMIGLPEGLLLLATDDETGRVATKSGALDHGLAGAVLSELLVSARLTVIGGKVVAADTSPTGDPILDEALVNIASSKQKDPKHWVSKLARTHLRDKFLERLTQKGVLRREEHRILWIIPDNRYPTEDSGPEGTIREIVRAAVQDGATSQPRTAVLIGILKACDLLGTVFTKEERKLHKHRIETIARAELMGEAVSKSIRDMQAATAAAVTAATTAAVVASSSSS